MDFATKTKFVDALLACPAMRDRNTRNAIVDKLPEVRSRIIRSDIDRNDVANIVDRLLDFDEELVQFMEILHFYEGESVHMQFVDSLYDNIIFDLPSGYRQISKKQRLSKSIVNLKFYAGIGVLLSILVILTIISNSDYFKNKFPIQVPIQEYIPTQTSTLTQAPIPTQTPMSTQIPIVILVPEATATFLPLKPASDNETLILVINFYLAANIDDAEPHRKIANAIREKIKENNVKNVRVEIEPNLRIREDEQQEARRIAKIYNASIVIWGDETSTNITVNFLNLRQSDTVIIKADSTSVHKAALVNPVPYIQFVTRDLPNQLTFLALFAVAQSEYNRKRYEKAATIIKLAVELLQVQTIEGIENAYLYLGWLYQVAFEDIDQAIIYYNRAIEFEPNYALAYYNRGLAYYDQAKYVESISDYDKAIELDAYYARAYNNRGVIYYFQRQYSKAILEYERAIESNPNFALPYNNVCRLHALTNKPEIALPYCEKAINKALIWEKPFYQDERGIVYALQGKTEEAIIDFQAFVEASEINNNFMDISVISKRKSWIQALQAGNNPFTQKLLKELLQEIETWVQVE